MTIQLKDDEDNIYEAVPEEDDYWYINWPEGGTRFHGTTSEVKREIARIISVQNNLNGMRRMREKLQENNMWR